MHRNQVWVSNSLIATLSSGYIHIRQDTEQIWEYDKYQEVKKI